MVCEFKGGDPSITSLISEAGHQIELWLIHLEANQVEDLLEVFIGNLTLLLGKDFKDSHEVETLLLDMHGNAAQEILVVLNLESRDSLVDEARYIKVSGLSLTIQEQLHKFFIVYAVVCGAQALQLKLKANQGLLVKQSRVVMLQNIDEVMNLDPALLFLIENLHSLD